MLVYSQCGRQLMAATACWPLSVLTRSGRGASLKGQSSHKLLGQCGRQLMAAAAAGHYLFLARSGLKGTVTRAVSIEKEGRSRILASTSEAPRQGPGGEGESAVEPRSHEKVRPLGLPLRQSGLSSSLS